jgi:hypothetical protein
MSEHLISWDSIPLRIDGTRLNALLRQYVAGQLDDITLAFRNGNIHVSGRKKVAFIPIPFSLDINEIRISEKTITVPVADISHIPAKLLSIFLPLIRGLIKPRIPVDAVTVQPPLTFVIQFDRLLPPYADVDIREIRIIDAGLTVLLGPGGVRTAVLRSSSQ